MANIISLDDKLNLSASQKAAVARRRKILAVRRIFQSTHGADKCERCQTALAPENRGKAQRLHMPYRFCDSCADEFKDYIDMLQGSQDKSNYWHNEAWMKVWRAWIDYRGAIDDYLRSDEFQRLVSELQSEPVP